MLPIFVVAAVGVTFLPSLDGQFLSWDDSTLLVQNSGYRGFGWTQLRWMFTSITGGHWMPLAWLSLAVNYALGGMNPWGYHVGNLLLHASSTIVLYFVASRLIAAAAGVEPGAPAVVLGGGFAALIFGLHPLRVETVAWAFARAELVADFFFLVAVLAWLRAVQGPGERPARGWRSVSLVAFALGGLAKPVVLPLPAVLLLLDVYPLERVRGLGWRRAIMEKAPHAALAVLLLVVAVLARARGVTLTSLGELGPQARIAMLGYSVVFYPWKFLWPVNLTPLYELPARVNPLEGRFLAAEVGLVVVSGTLVLLRRHWPAGLAAWVYSALLVLPVSGVVAHSGPHLVHDAYSNLSGLGFAVVAGGFVPCLARVRGLPPLAQSAAAVVAVVMLASLVAGSRRQSEIWHDSERLWRWAVSVDPGCVICSTTLASEILHASMGDQERAREAEGHLRRAIAARPGYAPSYYNLGLALATQRRYPEAEAAYLDFMRRRPNAILGPARLGLLYAEQERWAEAIPLLRQVHATGLGIGAVEEGFRLALGERARELGQAGRQEEAAALDREAEALMRHP